MARAANSVVFCLVLLLCLGIAGRAFAQKPDPMFYKEIQLTHKPYTLHSLSREMQRQSGITFSYNAAKVSANTKIRLRNDKLTVEQLLTLIRKKSGINYKIVSSSHIVYIEGPKKKGLFARKKEKKKPETVKNAVVKKPAQQVPAKQPVVVRAPAAADTAGPLRLVIIGDSSLAMAYYFSGGSNSGGAYTGSGTPKAPDADTWADPYMDLNAPANAKGYTDNKTVTFFKKNLLFALGASVDELYYFNPTVRAGFSFLYGTISYNLGSTTEWRYGLGTSARISDKWNMHLSFTTGRKINGDYNLITTDTTILPDPDSLLPPQVITTNTNNPIRVQSRLSRFSLILEYQITKDVTLSGGATLNYLTTSYTNNGQPVRFNDFVNSTSTDPDKDFRIIKPPYLLGNSYDGNSSSNNKMWIGLQLSLFYRIPFFGQ
jgi:hypothetical protein